MSKVFLYLVSVSIRQKDDMGIMKIFLQHSRSVARLNRRTNKGSHQQANIPGVRTQTVASFSNELLQLKAVVPNVRCTLCRGEI